MSILKLLSNGVSLVTDSVELLGELANKYKAVSHSKWKFVVTDRVEVFVPELKDKIVVSKYFDVIKGLVIIHKGYAWDGASGPVVNTENTLLGTLVHDVIYQAIEEGQLDVSYRVNGDNAFYRILRERGVSYFRAKAWFLAVRLFGGWHINVPK